jgi:hypothetical protein
MTMLGMRISTTISPGVPGGSGRSVAGSTTLTWKPGVDTPQLPGRGGAPGGT